MSGVFQILTPHPLTSRRVCTPIRLWCRGRTHSRRGVGGGGVNIMEDARHCSVLYISNYFVDHTIPRVPSFLSCRLNWPRPLTRKRLSPPPKLGTRGRHIRLRVRGGSQLGREEKAWSSEPLIFKLKRSPRIDSKEPIPSGCVAMSWNF
jgi:hypothetical protein